MSREEQPNLIPLEQAIAAQIRQITQSIPANGSVIASAIAAGFYKISIRQALQLQVGDNVAALELDRAVEQIIETITPQLPPSRAQLANFFNLFTRAQQVTAETTQNATDFTPQ